MSGDDLGKMFLVRGESQLEVVQPGAEVILDLKHEVLCGTVLSRSPNTIQFRPWGRPELTLSLARIVAAPVPEHTLADRCAAMDRQRAGGSAAPPNGCADTPLPDVVRCAIPIKPNLDRVKPSSES